jgi:hypothetical protein
MTPEVSSLKDAPTALPSTIGDVIVRLTEIVERSKRDQSRLGFFAALYRKVTIRVKDGIASGRFQDGARMERLDALFAGRYVQAYDQHQRGEQPTGSWQVSFRAARRWRPLILQHLLIGINAHINLDLGIAAVDACPGAELAGLEPDFQEINAVLAELVQPVQNEIGVVSPFIRFLETIDPHADDVVVNFSMSRAREAAWKFAVELNGTASGDRVAAIARRDREVALLGRLVERPGFVLLPLGLAVIRARESNDVARVIDVLS